MSRPYKFCPFCSRRVPIAFLAFCGLSGTFRPPRCSFKCQEGTNTSYAPRRWEYQTTLVSIGIVFAAIALLFASGVFSTPYSGAKLWFAVASGSAAGLLLEYFVIGIVRWLTLSKMHLRKVRS